VCGQTPFLSRSITVNAFKASETEKPVVSSIRLGSAGVNLRTGLQTFIQLLVVIA